MAIIKTVRSGQQIPQGYVFLERAKNGDVIVVHALMQNQI